MSEQDKATAQHDEDCAYHHGIECNCRDKATARPPWRLTLTCCTYEDGTRYFDTWEQADSFRNTHLDVPISESHIRSGIISRVDAVEERMSRFHTLWPGGWENEDAPKGGISLDAWAVTDEKRGGIIAYCAGEEMADALVEQLSAHEELVEALDRLLEYVNHSAPIPVPEAVTKARAALAKAKEGV